MPEEIGTLVDLELEFTLDVGYRLFDMLDDTAITKHENGYTVKLTLPENNWLYDFLMSFGHKVTIIRINEVVPSDPLQDFYGIPNADYLKTTIPLLQGAGAKTASIQDILQKGIYITNAVKTPKTDYTIDKSRVN